MHLEARVEHAFDERVRLEMRCDAQGREPMLEAADRERLYRSLQQEAVEGRRGCAEVGLKPAQVLLELRETLTDDDGAANNVWEDSL